MLNYEKQIYMVKENSLKIEFLVEARDFERKISSVIDF